MNKFNIPKIKQLIAFYAFLALFPGFFIYHSLLALTEMPAFLGGYFSIVSVLIIFIYSVFYFLEKQIYKAEFLFISILLAWLFAIFYQFFKGEYSEENNLILLSFGLSGILSNLACFFIGVNINLGHKKYTNILLITFFMLFVIVILNIENGQFYLRNKYLNEQVASYQGFGRSIMVVVFLLFSIFFNRKIFLTTILYILSILMFYLNGSRSELIFFVVTTMWIFVLDFIRYPNLKKIFFRGIVLGFTALIVSYIIGNFEDNRILNLLNISDDTSYMERKILQKTALDSIENNPLFGLYGYYIDVHGKGGYVHNILSIWADYGIIFFALYLLIICYFFIHSAKKYTVNKRDLNMMYCLFATCLFVAVLTSKEYTYMMFGFTFGLYINTSKHGM